jgi:2-keto-4-pentenoate hydratase
MQLKDPLQELSEQLDVDMQRRSPFKPLRISGNPLNHAQAYAIQAQIIERAQARGAGERVGYKVGLTSKAMQKFCGVDQPLVGQIFGTRVRARQPARLRTTDYGRLGLECEIAVRISKPIENANGGADVAGLIDHIDAVAAAFEIIDDRAADYRSLDAFSIIAENSWNQGIVLAEPATPEKLADIDGLTCRLLIDNEQAATGNSRDVMGGPRHVLAWLAQFTAAERLPLNAGDWIMTGSVIATMFPKPGQTFRFEVESLGAVEAIVA